MRTRRTPGSSSPPQPVPIWPCGARRPDPSRGQRTPPLSSTPFSRSQFDATASTAVDSEQPSVMLDEWWLARVEEDERKIAICGFYEKNGAFLDFASAPVAKCHNLRVLETEDGTVVFLDGFFNSNRTLQNGFTTEACEKFYVGFPYWWETWNECYPKMISSQARNKPSSTGSNSGEDSNVPLSSTVECTNDEGQVGIDNASHMNKGCQKTSVASLKNQGCPKKLQSIALHDMTVLSEATDQQSSKKPVGPSRKQRSAFQKFQCATRSPNIDKQSPLTRGKLKSSLATPESLKLKRSRSGRVIVPTLDSALQTIVYDPDGSISAIIGLDSPLKGSTQNYHASKKKRAN